MIVPIYGDCLLIQYVHTLTQHIEASTTLGKVY